MLTFDIQQPVVYYAFDWLLLIQGPIRGLIYEFQYEFLNFIMKFETKFATFREHLVL